MASHLTISRLTRHFASPRGAIPALHDVSLDIVQSEFVCIVGPSGCGKSTLLRLIAGLIRPSAGSIEFAGWPATPKMRLVFQDHALFPWMTVADNVAFGLEMEEVAAAIRRERAIRQLTTLGMAAFADHYPYELSGGMRQRVAIARAFITEPDILLMDEPLRALDAQLRRAIQEELLSLWQDRRPMVLYVTHDIEEALLLADRVIVMHGHPGRIREEIVPPFDRPRDLTGRRHRQLEELKWHIWGLLEQNVKPRIEAS